MSATLLSEDGEARLARLAWRDLRWYIAKYPQLELTRASEIAKYLRELAVEPRGRDKVRDAVEQLSDSRVAMPGLARIGSRKREKSREN